MKKNAFTLIELIAVIVILSIVLTLSVPSLIGALKNNKEKSLEKINELIILAAKDYVVDYGLEIPRKITQNELCKNYLDCPIINPVTKEEMVFSVIVDENKNYTIDKNELIELKVVLNGGKLSKDISGGYTPNTEIILETPTRERHGFAGWEVVSGDAVIEGSVLKLGTKNSTLVANWVGTPVKLNVDLDGGTSSINYNSEYYTRNTLDLGTPTKENYLFLGWKLVSGDAVLSGNKLTFGYEDVSVKATWIRSVNEFAYSGSEQTFTALETGYYKLEVWGAQGGGLGDFLGGYGGYSSGMVYLTKGQKLYINVGGEGSYTTGDASVAGGYNGGGAGGCDNDNSNGHCGSGGGATHIATTSGVLSTLKDNIQSVLIVAGGGGGRGGNSGTSFSGGSAGGILGNIGSQASGDTNGSGGMQIVGGKGSASGSFGAGGSDTATNSWGRGGGGGGFYGGGSGYQSSGGGGSGYIGNTLIFDKSMYCYNCIASGSYSAKTISTTCTNINAVERCSKQKNGHAKITLVAFKYDKTQFSKNDYEEMYYGGIEQTFIVPETGYYKLESWGAQGGGQGDFPGGYGGYSMGYAFLTKGQKVYINVGGVGQYTTGDASVAGGYNGGGAGGCDNDNSNGYCGSGGGATHIATTSGLLSTLKNNVQSVLIVAGGGGGRGGNSGTSFAGGSAGGILGNIGSITSGDTNGSGGMQTKGGTGSASGTFGAGGSDTAINSWGRGGGGGGFYGGGSGYQSSGGGGSGYIGNTLLTNKVMYCYNCTASGSYSAKTISTTCSNLTATDKCSKQKNGHAKITYVADDYTKTQFSKNDYEEMYYTGSEQTFTAPLSGYYKLEVWGAQGGGQGDFPGGYGGYSVGKYYLKKDQMIYITIGGKGSYTTGDASVGGGYNGGGAGGCDNDNSYGYCGSGGGATHIATVSGLLSSLSSNVDKILIVAGGGGGRGGNGSTSFAGGSAGGILGNIGTKSNGETNGTGGTQTAGGTGSFSGSFGLGGSDTTTNSWGRGGGGGGFYGGGSGLKSSGGGGSGYIGNSLLTSKAMYCYNCTASSDTATKTISTTCTNKNATEKCSKQGNGYAKVTYIGE